MYIGALLVYPFLLIFIVTGDSLLGRVFSFFSQECRMRVLLSCQSIDASDIRGPVFFLAGPVIPTDDWQRYAARCIERQEAVGREATVIIPCEWDSTHPLWAQSCYAKDGDILSFPAKNSWKHHWLNVVSQRSQTGGGCIMFWLPAPPSKPPLDWLMQVCGIYSDLGFWRGAKLFARPEMKLVVGGEPGFPSFVEFGGELALNALVSYSKAEPVWTCNSLQETISTAIASCSWGA